MSGAVGGQSDADVTAADIQGRLSSKDADNLRPSAVLYPSSSARSVEATVEFTNTSAAARSLSTVASLQQSTLPGSTADDTTTSQPVDPSQIPIRYYLGSPVLPSFDLCLH